MGWCNMQRFGPVPGPIGGPADTTTFAAERPQLPRPGNVQSWAEAPTALPPLPGPLELFPIPGQPLHCRHHHLWSSYVFL